MQKSLLHPLTVFILMTCLLAAPIHATDRRILVECTINGKPAHLIYDTSTSGSMLFRSSAEKLGIKIIPRASDAPTPMPGTIAVDMSEVCEVKLGDSSQKSTFAIYNDPVPLLQANWDGFFSWNDVREIDGNVFLIDMTQHKCADIPLPADIGKWEKWKIVPDEAALTFECPNGNETLKISINTGFPEGVVLNDKQWEKWHKKRLGKPTTLEATASAAAGLVVSEVLRAKKIALGGLVLNDVPVTTNALGSHMHGDVILGLFALTQMKLIVDRKGGFIYTFPISNSKEHYDYNRMGAVFVPKDFEKGDDLIANVAKGSPAGEAGVRDGDILLKIGDLDVTKWRTDPKVLPLGRFWSQPPGTQLKLLLKRGDETHEITVTLKEPEAVD